MAIEWNATELDAGDWIEWCERHDYDAQDNNWTLFTRFVFALAAIRPSATGDIGADEAKTFILRYTMLQKVSDYAADIPIEFVRRMIGLKTNVFPRTTDKAFDKEIGERVREFAHAALPTGWSNF